MNSNPKMKVLDIKGKWDFSLDREAIGIRDGWMEQSMDHTIELPGSLQEQGFGNIPSTDTKWVGTLYDRFWFQRKPYKQFASDDNFKIPFWLTPKRHYMGTAWYQREIEIPHDWLRKRVVLFLERVHWSSTVWLDGREIGFDDCLSAPHIHDLGFLEPGRHRLSIMVDNRILKTVREDAHSVTDSTQSNWNGIVGAMELRATSSVYLKSVRTYPDIYSKSVRCEVEMGNASGKTGKGVVSVRDTRVDVTWSESGGRCEFTVPLPKDAGLWDEFHSELHDFTVVLEEDNILDEKHIRVGLCKPAVQNGQFTINGRPTYFRGNHEGCQFPLTGYPPVDVNSWRKIMDIYKAYGLNHLRFHSFCPPDAAFVAADEAGIYLQVECSHWGHFYQEKDDLVEWIGRETERIIETYGNHPSFILFSNCNEPKGAWMEPLLDWCKHWRKLDPRRLYTSHSGHLMHKDPVPEMDYHVTVGTGAGCIFRGESGWHGANYEVPIQCIENPPISHELGQWCAFPDFREIEKYSGSFRARNYEIFRDSMDAQGLLDMADAFVQSSGAFQLECYKQDIEAHLRTPSMGGFQLLDLHDYQGQGTAPIGLMNIFWESKGYVSPELFRRFCSQTVPLARLRQTLFRANETLLVPVEVAHFGAEPLVAAVLTWAVINAEGHEVNSGRFKPQDISLGLVSGLGHIQIDLSSLRPDRKYMLKVGIVGFEAENDWEFWLYPAEDVVASEEDIRLTRNFDEALEALEGGEKVLLIPRYHDLNWRCPHVGRVPIFWNRLMGPKWERFLGIHCDPSHPALSGFVTDAHYDWQWEDVFQSPCRGINLDLFPAALKPVVHIIDDWNRNYKLSALVECQVGKGKLMICAPDVVSNLENRPAARQLRNSLLDYMRSDKFWPHVEVNPEDLCSIRFDNRVMLKLGASVESSSHSHKREAEYVLDGNPNSYWLSGFGGDGHPHELSVSFPQAIDVSGLQLLNRQDHRAYEGDIREFEVLAQCKGSDWECVAQGELESTLDPQFIDFGKIIQVDKIKLRAVSGYGKDTVSSLACLNVVYEGPRLDVALDDTKTYDRSLSSTEEMIEEVSFFNYRIRRIVASDEQTGHPAINIQDGDPNTVWRGDLNQGPLSLTFTLGQAGAMTALTFLSGSDPEKGRIKDLSVEVTSDGEQWNEVLRGSLRDEAGQQSLEMPPRIGGFGLRLNIMSPMVIVLLSISLKSIFCHSKYRNIGYL
jgi:hypothetical protein